MITDDINIAKQMLHSSSNIGWGMSSVINFKPAISSYFIHCISGALGVIWFILWALLAHDSPSKHPRISREEKEYIEKSIGTAKVVCN